jgi:hypothetical protein
MGCLEQFHFYKKKRKSGESRNSKKKEGEGSDLTSNLAKPTCAT